VNSLVDALLNLFSFSSHKWKDIGSSIKVSIRMIANKPVRDQKDKIT